MTTGNRRVVIGYDGSDGSRRALRWAAERARQQRCALEVVHAAPLWPYDAPDPDTQERRRGQELVRP